MPPNERHDSDIQWREVAARLLDESERAQAALARTIHDDLAQQLTLATMELGLWQQELEASNAGTVSEQQSRDKITAISELLSNAIATTRALSGSLRPRTFDSFGIGPAIESLLQQLRKRTGIISRFRCDPDLAGSKPPYGIHLLRAFEAILAQMDSTTVATSISVELSHTATNLRLRISGATLPVPPASAMTRLRAFGGSSTHSDRVLTLELPVPPG